MPGRHLSAEDFESPIDFGREMRPRHRRVPLIWAAILAILAFLGFEVSRVLLVSQTEGGDIERPPPVEQPYSPSPATPGR
ncbi:MAG: hypothetical protein WDA71_05885 [Actinomycetota bacterium]|jgi:hypothetical protein